MTLMLIWKLLIFIACISLSLISSIQPHERNTGRLIDPGTDFKLQATFHSLKRTTIFYAKDSGMIFEPAILEGAGVIMHTYDISKDCYFPNSDNKMQGQVDCGFSIGLAIFDFGLSLV